MTQTDKARLGSIILATADMKKALAFYRNAFGFDEMFVDGPHWAMLETGGARIALAGVREQLEDPIALAVKVEDLPAALAAAEAAGAATVSPIRQGKHENRAEIRSPDGHLISVYSPTGQREDAVVHQLNEETR